MIFKLSVDVLMTAALAVLMGYQFWGETAHEWVGTGMFLLFITHHILNSNRYKRLFKGKYGVLRTVNLCVDFLVLLSMTALMFSAVVISRRVFAFLQIESGFAVARRLHILGSYWGFLLMNVHLGLHWNMMLSIISKTSKAKLSRAGKVVLRSLSGLVALHGAAAFVRRDFPGCLFLKNEFVFLDYGESRLLFYFDFFALTVLCVFLSHYAAKLLKSKKKKVKPSAAF